MLIRKELLSIGEVSQITGLPVHTLRFWENEFGRYLQPLRTTGRQRRYTEAEVRRILEIKKLLREDKYSIAGAKQVLSLRLQAAQAGLDDLPPLGKPRDKDRSRQEPVYVVSETVS